MLARGGPANASLELGFLGGRKKLESKAHPSQRPVPLLSRSYPYTAHTHTLSRRYGIAGEQMTAELMAGTFLLPKYGLPLWGSILPQVLVLQIVAASFLQI